VLDLSGIFPPLPTPFDSDELLNGDAMRKNIRMLSPNGLAGFLVLGSNGEMVHLSFKEKCELFEIVRDAIPEHQIMLAGTGCPSTRETQQLTRAAARAGADAALVLNPHYYKSQMTPSALISHYWNVADASRIPVLIYNMPSNTGIDMDADTIVKIAEHDNIIGLKDSGGNVTKMAAIQQKMGRSFQVLAGSAGFLLPALSIGAVGGILALANIFPTLCQELFQSHREGQLSKASQLQLDVIEVNTAVTRRWGVPALKAAMDHLGLAGGFSRKPFTALNPSQELELLGLVDGLSAKYALKSSHPLEPDIS